MVCVVLRVVACATRLSSGCGHDGGRVRVRARAGAEREDAGVRVEVVHVAVGDEVVFEHGLC